MLCSILHFSEIYFEEQGQRIFNIAVEGKEVFSDVDIVQLGGGYLKAITLETPQTVTDGSLTISFSDGGQNSPKVSGIEVIKLKPHLAHAVAGGPYSAIDSNGDGFETIAVDGGLSHT